MRRKGYGLIINYYFYDILICSLSFIGFVYLVICLDKLALGFWVWFDLNYRFYVLILSLPFGNQTLIGGNELLSAVLKIMFDIL